MARYGEGSAVGKAYGDRKPSDYVVPAAAVGVGGTMTSRAVRPNVERALQQVSDAAKIIREREASVNAEAATLNQGVPKRKFIRRATNKAKLNSRTKSMQQARRVSDARVNSMVSRIPAMTDPKLRKKKGAIGGALLAAGGAKLWMDSKKKPSREVW